MLVHCAALCLRYWLCRLVSAMAAGDVTFEAPLSQAFGYGIILGLGFAFSLVMIFITWALKRYALRSSWAAFIY